MNAADLDDVLIVGAGPAGTSAALALAGSGLRVRLLDAGAATTRIGLPPDGDWLALRRNDAAQWHWQLGERFEALAAPAGSSPKLRVPGLQPVFAGYAQANRIAADGFQLVGALAAGGLSNAWGCGVAAFSDDELAPLDGIERAALREGYRVAALRMGLSGRADDALADALGVDAWAQPALPLDPLHARLFARRGRGGADFRLGRARVAVLSRDDVPGRRACDLRGACLFGCTNRATWSAALDLDAIERGGVRIESGTVVQALRAAGDGWSVDAHTPGGTRRFVARKVLLAAGTLASTRLALAALPAPPGDVALQSNPLAAFLAFVPGRFGAAPARGFGLAQLSFTAAIDGGGPAFGNLFATTGLPVSEFLGYLPFARRAGLPLLRALLPACTVGNVFLPGGHSAHRVSLDRDGALRVRGGAGETLPRALASARTAVASGLRAAGAWMLPGSFVPGAPGADVHYASTLPIRRAPRAHECHANGEIAALPGVHAIDGASLPQLPAKAHTLTIMANADRIARGVRDALRG